MQKKRTIIYIELLLLCVFAPSAVKVVNTKEEVNHQIKISDVTTYIDPHLVFFEPVRKYQTSKTKKSVIKKIIPVPHDEITVLIKKYADHYKVDSSLMIKIAYCESRFIPDAKNGSYGGIYQFHPKTWESNRKAMGLPTDSSLRFDKEESIKTAAFKMARDGYSAWPTCSKV